MQILIVDDERTARTIHGSYVRRLEGCEALCCGNPGEALEWAATHDPDMVIVDYLMPVMDGLEFTRRLRRLPGKESTPVLMVTNYQDEDVRKLARSVGVNEFLIKPVDRIELSACILNLSGVRAARKKTTMSPPPDYDSIDSAALATILAERDRLRTVDADGQSEAEAADKAGVALACAAPRSSDDILILDDEAVSISALDRFVRNLKCYPVRFAHPRNALEWCETHQPIAVIVDYMMPDIDGLQFTRRFRMLPGKADIPVLMVSAYGDSLLKQSALAAGVNELLHKPVDASDLMARLRTILAARELQKRLAKHERLYGINQQARQ